MLVVQWHHVGGAVPRSRSQSQQRMPSYAMFSCAGLMPVTTAKDIQLLTVNRNVVAMS